MQLKIWSQVIKNVLANDWKRVLITLHMGIENWFQLPFKTCWSLDKDQKWVLVVIREILIVGWHYYKMWVQFTSPCSLNQWIHSKSNEITWHTKTHFVIVVCWLKIFNRQLLNLEKGACNMFLKSYCWMLHLGTKGDQKFGR
jgi:hypothetical protein